VNGLSAEVFVWVGTIDGAATSGFWLDLAMGVCSRDFGWGIVVFGSLVGQLLLAFFFLLALLCQISLAFFELVVWFGQEVTFDGGKCRFERHKSDENWRYRAA